MLARRQLEATNLAALAGEYVDPRMLEVKVEPTKLARTKGYDLLLRWLFGMVLRQLEASRDRQIAALVRHLKKFREARQRDELGGPYVKLTGKVGRYLAQGQAWPNAIDMDLGLPGMNPVELLADDEHQTRRTGLMTELATGFIHETAHLRQIAKYQNDSHPWEPSFSSSGMFAKGDPGIPMARWTDEVLSAYQEFERGGADRQAVGYPEWERLKKAITADAYYWEGSWDRRGRELVSHLIELVYTWQLARPFAEVFPMGSELIDRVLADL